MEKDKNMNMLNKEFEENKLVTAIKGGKLTIPYFENGLELDSTEDQTELYNSELENLNKRVREEESANRSKYLSDVKLIAYAIEGAQTGKMTEEFVNNIANLSQGSFESIRDLASIISVTEDYLLDRLMNGDENEINIIIPSEAVNVVLEKTLGTKDYVISKQLFRDAEKKLDKRLSSVVHEGLLGFANIVSGTYDASDVDSVVALNVFVRDNQAQFYN